MARFDLVKTLDAIVDREDLTLLHKGVLFVLLRHADSDGGSWPSYDRVAKKARVARSTAIRTVRELVAMNVLRAEHRRDADGHRTSNRYTLHVVSRGDQVVAGEDHLVSAGDQGESSTETRVVAERDQGGLPGRPEGTQGRNTEKEHSGRSNPTFDAFHLEAPEPEGPKPKLTKRGKAPKTLITEDWQPTDKTIAWARMKEVDATACVEEFVNHWKGEGKPMADWQAVFKKRVLQLIDYGRAPALVSSRLRNPVAPAKPWVFPDEADDDDRTVRRMPPVRTPNPNPISAEEHHRRMAEVDAIVAGNVLPPDGIYGLRTNALPGRNVNVFAELAKGTEAAVRAAAAPEPDATEPEDDEPEADRQALEGGR